MGLLKTYSIANDITGGAVNHDKLDAELKAGGDIVNFSGLSIYDDSIEVLGDSFISEANVDTIVLNHISVDVIANIKASYITKEIDGCKYFDQQRAEMVLDYQSEILTEQDLYDIEDAYEPVFKRLLKGDWMSAKNKLSGVAIGGAVTQARHDVIVAYITDYVDNNY